MRRRHFIIQILSGFSAGLASAVDRKPNDALAGPGLEPVRNKNGSYDCMLESMKKGEVTEVQASKITKWGKPVLRPLEGVSYWVVEVQYPALFGPPTTTAAAFIRHNRVVTWRYPSSLEIVP